MDVSAYFAAQAEPDARYRGQLAPDVQAALAARYATEDQDACWVTHTVDLPGGRTLAGALDLRGSEEATLGGVDVRGRRVLEVGPLSGWLTGHLAGLAREVVALELAPGAEDILTPALLALPDTARDDLSASLEKLRRSWWLNRREAGWTATMVYGDPHRPPADLGRFDVTVLAMVLLRLPHPLLALEKVAAITDGTLVITEPLTAVAQTGGDATPVALFAPGTGEEGSQHWWHHSPAALMRMLMMLGFGDLRLTMHTAPRMNPGLPMFTLVGRRATAA